MIEVEITVTTPDGREIVVKQRCMDLAIGDNITDRTLETLAKAVARIKGAL